MTFTNDKKLLSCATDGIKLWDPYNTPKDTTPIATWQEGGPYTALSAHRTGNSFAASSGAGCIRVWDLEQSTAAQTIQWPNFTDTITDVAFNQVETSVVGSVATDRSLILFDLRTNSALPFDRELNHGQLTLKRSTRYQDRPPVCGKPHRLQPNGSHEHGCGVRGFVFLIICLWLSALLTFADHNIYIFDARNFDRAQNIQKGHVAAVMDVEFSPTGEELVSGSYVSTLSFFSAELPTNTM